MLKSILVSKCKLLFWRVRELELLYWIWLLNVKLISAGWSLEKNPWWKRRPAYSANSATTTATRSWLASSSLVGTPSKGPKFTASLLVECAFACHWPPGAPDPLTSMATPILNSSLKCPRTRLWNSSSTVSRLVHTNFSNNDFFFFFQWKLDSRIKQNLRTEILMSGNDFSQVISWCPFLASKMLWLWKYNFVICYSSCPRHVKRRC